MPPSRIFIHKLEYSRNIKILFVCYIILCNLISTLPHSSKPSNSINYKGYTFSYLNNHNYLYSFNFIFNFSNSFSTSIGHHYGKTPLYLKNYLSNKNHDSQIKPDHFLQVPNRNLPRIIITGPPCSGKGTQCQLLKERYDLPHISSGDLVRNTLSSHLKEHSSLKDFVQKGKLVPDSFIVKLVCERIEQKDCETKGWLLDGFPRTFNQAVALKSLEINPTHVFLLDAPLKLLLTRSKNRRLDPVTGKIYNLISTPPETKLIQDRLIQRSDDLEEVMKQRIQTYLEETNLLKQWYEQHIISLDATLSSKDTFEEICKIIDLTINK